MHRVQDNSTKISVIIVTWNSQEYIKQCLDSIISEQIRNHIIEIIIVDNNSSDDTLAILRKISDISIIENRINIGFCAANNIGILRSSGEYVLLINPDVVLSYGFISNAIDILKNNPQVALLTGKILLMNGERTPKTKDDQAIIDTVGIKMYRNRQAVDIGQGEIDQGQYDKAQDVFGVSAAVCLCRRQALMDAMIDGQVFDNTFFAYKEDVDLSWRLGLFGWKCWYTPQVVAFHARGWKTGLKHRSEIPRIVRYYSFKNRRIMILKNDTLKTILPDIFHILWFELQAFIYILVKEQFLLKAYWEIIKDVPRIRQWRREIHRRSRIRSVSQEIEIK